MSSRSEAGGSSVSYGYDDIGRLTSQSDAFAGGTGNVARTLAFNPASGLTTETRDNDSYAFPTSQIGSVNRAYGVNGLNQYTSAGPASFTYDANGNLTGDGTWVYTYDVENRLVHATGAGKDVYVTYDPLGRLVELSGGGIGDVYLLEDGDALIAEYAVSTGGMTNRYVHGSNAAADDPLVWYEGSVVSSAYRQLLHTDHLGSIVARTNGGAPAINSYDEYGIPATTNSGRFGYTGQAYLFEIGLDYYKARMYSPTLGRFLQTDPIGYEGGINIYEYAADDPVDNEDPTGNDCGSRIPGQDAAGCFGVTALVKSQDEARKNKSFQPTHGITHCNQALCDITKQLGLQQANSDLVGPNGEPLIANQQAADLSKSRNWKEVSPDEAQKMANDGRLVVVAYRNPNPHGHGHVATVRPEGVPGDHPVGRSGPLLNNIGSTVGIEHASKVFTSNAEVHYYTPR